MANNYDQYTDYLAKMRENMLSQVQEVEYNPQSASALKSALAKALRPEYEAAIKNRNKTAAKNRAAIDADAAARGMGTSTWVTDVKNRQNDAAASDIANIEGDYISTLYGNLLNRLGTQEQNKLSVDQYNSSLRQGALDRAQAATDQWWQTWKPNTGSAKTQTGLEDDPRLAKIQQLIKDYNKAGQVQNAPQTNTGLTQNTAKRHISPNNYKKLYNK